MRQAFIHFEAHVKVDFNHTPDSKIVEIYAYNRVTRGHHIYKETWTSHIDEKMIAGWEEGNVFDGHTVATYYEASN